MNQANSIKFYQYAVGWRRLERRIFEFKLKCGEVDVRD